MKKTLVCLCATLLLVATSQIMAITNNIQLPQFNLNQGLLLNQAIAKRRSTRAFDPKPLTIKQISQLLWATQGITDHKTGFRSAPSAGALYPLEIFLVKSDGLWHYSPHKHSMIKIKSGDLREPLAAAAFGQNAIMQAPADIVIAADYSRTTKKYGRAGIRYVHIEVGHAAENLVLEAANLGLAAVTIGGFHDRTVNKLLSLPKDLSALYIVALGTQ